MVRALPLFWRLGAAIGGFNQRSNMIYLHFDTITLVDMLRIYQGEARAEPEKPVRKLLKKQQ